MLHFRSLRQQGILFWKMDGACSALRGLAPGGPGRQLGQQCRVLQRGDPRPGRRPELQGRFSACPSSRPVANPASKREGTPAQPVAEGGAGVSAAAAGSMPEETGRYPVPSGP